MSRKKIAIVAPDLSLRGGVTTVVEFLYRTVAECKNFEPELVSLATSSRDKNSKRLINPKTWQLNSLRSDEKYNQGLSYTHFGANFTEFEPMRYAPRRELTDFLNQFDLIQLVSGTPSWAHILRDVTKPCCLQAATTARSERASAIKNASVLSQIYGRTAVRINDFLEKRLPPAVNTIFVENYEMLAKMRQYAPAAEVIFAPPGVDENFYEPLDNKNLSERYIFCVGRLDDPRKNISLLLEAFALLKEKKSFSFVELKLASKAPLKAADIETAKRLGIENSLTMLINISIEELRDAYQRAELFALSSDEEGLGLVIAEAMACGLPVVSTDCIGSRVLVKENVNGFLSTIGDVHALAENLEKVLQSRELQQKFGTASRQIIEQNFTLAKSGKRFLDRYRQLLSQ